MAATSDPGSHLAVNGWFWGQLTTGSGQYLQHLVRYLPQVAPNLQLTLVLPSWSIPSPTRQSPHTDLPEPWQIYAVDMPLRRLNRNQGKVWFEQFAFPRACRQRAASVALVPYWGSPWWRPCPLAVTIHDLIPLLLPAYRGGLPQRLYTQLVAMTARRAHCILTDSQASRHDIIQYLSMPEQQVSAVLLAAGEHFLPVQDQAELQRVQAKYGLPPRFILYLGGFDVRKNVDRLVQAYARFRTKMGPGHQTPHLVLAGRLPTTPTDFTPDPLQVVSGEGLTQWVHFTGWVDEDDKPALYSLAEAFIFPSLYEGFGLPVAEAQRCGTPVVTSNRSSLPEAGPGAVLVDPEDVDSIATGIGEAMAMKLSPPRLPGRTWRDVVRETWSVLRTLD
jgi:glycosyltransferase involved in cell wall biosynthesis